MLAVVASAGASIGVDVVVVVLRANILLLLYFRFCDHISVQRMAAFFMGFFVLRNQCCPKITMLKCMQRKPARQRHMHFGNIEICLYTFLTSILVQSTLCRHLQITKCDFSFFVYIFMWNVYIPHAFAQWLTASFHFGSDGICFCDLERYDWNVPWPNALIAIPIDQSLFTFLSRTKSTTIHIHILQCKFWIKNTFLFTFVLGNILNSFFIISRIAVFGWSTVAMNIPENNNRYISLW